MTPDMTQTPITATLARFATGLRYEALPAAVVERAQLLFMDLTGIMVYSQSLDSTQSLEQTLVDLGHATGSLQVPGQSGRWTPQAAALLAGAAAHSLDFDDTHARGQIHPGAPIIPAALAAAQMVGATTQDLLTAIVAGYEVMIRVAMGVNARKHGEHGFHPSATTGVFGAAAAAGRLLGLSASQMEDAFGTALSMSAGTGQFAVNGAWTKRFHVGNAAASGLLAAALARRHYTGATQALEGHDGFFRIYSTDPQPQLALEGLGRVWEILQCGLKPYPCCRGIHAPLDAVMALHARHAISVDQIASVTVGMARRSVQVVGEPQDRRRQPKNVVDCQFSTHLCLSIALKHKRLSWDDYEAALKDPEIHALMQRIDVREDAECEANFPTAFSGVVEIRTHAGETFREFVYMPQGEPETMLSAQALRAKFSQLVVPILGSAGEQKLFDQICRMSDPSPVGTLMASACP